MKGYINKPCIYCGKYKLIFTNKTPQGKITPKNQQRITCLNCKKDSMILKKDIKEVTNDN